LLDELDREWDVDRALMANFAIVGGVTFAVGVNRMRARRGRWHEGGHMRPTVVSLVL
jgi:hypothetical protein